MILAIGVKRVVIIQKRTSHRTIKDITPYSASGGPAFVLEGNKVNDYIEKAHAILREKLEAGGYKIEEEFTCPG